ncbi:Mad3/BUB1 homology region 1-domain-containing protein [Vararia minispora EC-137]|uniref:Mad3/BUB1 homology region 1-domain-containing protein n=1 Tax=Vararia minispora EC-137 TaxID=1314806 RepID=A0ACB8QXP8_9AGAM|nr:Mad3/BUB1 homology region 1-domain-containing protein [Vararia minispora EC-137]
MLAPTAPTSPDVFTEDEPDIVDGDVIEAAKENIQPLASGRRATTLSAILSTPHSQRESKLAATRHRLRINVEIAMQDDDDDPLQAYCNLVYWTVENYPQGHSAESGILELLEEATRVLKDDREGAWRSDLRYLKLWVLYASYVEKPTVIFRYLLANEIGTSFSLLYEEHAIALEKSGRRTQADEIYLLGINRNAEPLERLQVKHREFQKRMMIAVASRTVLGESSTKTSRSSRTTPTSSAASATIPAPSSSESSRPGPNSRLQIFVDPTGDGAQAADENSATPWEELGSRKARVKENVPSVSKMKGTTLKQPGKHLRSVSTSSSGSKIAVFRDPAPSDGNDMPPPPVPAPHTPARGSFTPRRDDPERPSTPRFMPYQDEPVTPSSSTPAASGSVMKAKPVRSGGLSSQAEALRKDPFLNYADKPVDIE